VSGARRRRLSPWGAVRGLLLALIAAVWLGPYAWMTVTSFKTSAEVLQMPAYPLPRSLQFDAYREVFATVPVARCFANSLIMSLSIATLQIALALPAGYALAKRRFVGRGMTFGLVVGALLIPPQVTFVPIFMLLGSAHLVNSMFALVVPFAVSALGTFLVRQALLSVPDEIIEAARLDGAGQLRIVYEVLAPILRPTLAAMFLFSFVYHYSDYFWPLVMTTDDSVRPLPLAIALLREQGTGTRWNVVMAGNVLLSLPILLAFAFAQRHILAAVTMRRSV
jgi:sn-glycerol 3-phosphate transport system permease protein